MSCLIKFTIVVIFKESCLRLSYKNMRNVNCNKEKNKREKERGGKSHQIERSHTQKTQVYKSYSKMIANLCCLIPHSHYHLQNFPFFFLLFLLFLYHYSIIIIHNFTLFSDIILFSWGNLFFSCFIY